MMSKCNGKKLIRRNVSMNKQLTLSWTCTLRSLYSRTKTSFTH